MTSLHVETGTCEADAAAAGPSELALRTAARRLVGRDQELVALQRASVAAGALVRGPVGIGKSRLLLEAVRRDVSARWIRDVDDLQVRPLGARGRETLVVDDAHSLDQQTARKLGRVIAQGGVSVLLAADERAPLPSALAPLVRSFEVIDLEPLLDRDIDALAHNLLGGPLCSVAGQRLRSLADGNPLYALMLLEDASARGQLRHDPDGVVRLCGDLEVPASLAAVVLQSYERLDAVGQASAARLALAQPLPVGLMRRIVTPASFAELEAAGVARMHDGVAELTGRLITESLLTRLGPGERRAHCLELSCSIGTDHPGSPLVPAVWQLESGEPDDADLLLAGAQLAATRLDHDLAGRLSAAARIAGASGQQLRWAGVTEANMQPLTSQELADAFALIMAGRFSAASARLDQLQAAELDVRREGASSTGVQRWATPLREIARTMLEAYAGDVSAAAGRASEQLQVAVDHEVPALIGSWQAVVGHLAALRGDLVSADRFCGDAVAALSDSDPLGLRHVALCQRALVAAESGALLLVEDLLVTLQMAGASHPWMEIHLARVEAHHEALIGNPLAAAKRAIAAGELALELGCDVWAAFAFHDAARLGMRPDLVAAPLASASSRCEGGLAGILADHVQAAVAADPAGLRAAGDALLRVGSRLRASEVFLAASDLQEGTAAEQLRRRAGACIGRLARGPMPVDREVTEAAIFEPPTAREQEVVGLVAAGRSSPSVARELGISSRTVENHLARAARKVGADGRADLGLLLGV